jgi:hypothetical protein
MSGPSSVKRDSLWTLPGMLHGWCLPDPGFQKPGSQGKGAHLWSGLGLPFLRMLLAVVSLKCSRPTVTFVTCSGGRLTLQRRGRVLRGQREERPEGHPGQEHAGDEHWVPGWLSISQASSRHNPTEPDTHVTGLKGLLLRSDWDCSMLMDWFRASS